MMRKFVALSLGLVVVFTLLFSAHPVAESNGKQLTILFTHDLHSHIDAYTSSGKDIGGFARIKSIIDETVDSNDNTLVIDAGDFSMGTLYQTLYKSDAAELRLLGEMGYDAVMFGNHEFDYGDGGFAEMLYTAKRSGSRVPQLVCSNVDLTLPYEGDTLNLKSALSEYGAREYLIIEKSGIKIVLFGLLGDEAKSCAPSTKLSFTDKAETLKKMISEIKAYTSPDIFICLSHSGTGDAVDDEDIKLAKEVPELDVIISAHSHTTLQEPVYVGDTVMVSSGKYGQYVGKLTVDLDGSRCETVDYRLIEVNDSINENQTISDMIEGFGSGINNYLSKFGYSDASDILAYSPFDFAELDEIMKVQNEQTIGNIISDAYFYAVREAEGDNYSNVDVAVVPAGTIRDSIEKGNVTVSKAFEICSMGIGEDGVSGFPLCSVYLYGSELKTLAEVDASVSLIMPEARLYCSGMTYAFNTKRMFLNRVYDCSLYDSNGTISEIEDNKLYRVVAGMYSAQMLGTVNSKSFGLLSLTPKDVNGTPITDFNKMVIKTSEGAELKEWKALADYLSSFNRNGDGVPVIPQIYAQPDGRKQMSTDFSFDVFFRSWNFASFCLLGVILFVIAVVLFTVFRIKRRIRKKKRVALADSPEIV